MNTLIYVIITLMWFGVLFSISTPTSIPHCNVSDFVVMNTGSFNTSSIPMPNGTDLEKIEYLMDFTNENLPFGESQEYVSDPTDYMRNNISSLCAGHSNFLIVALNYNDIPAWKVHLSRGTPNAHTIVQVTIDAGMCIIDPTYNFYYCKSGEFKQLPTQLDVTFNKTERMIKAYSGNWEYVKFNTDLKMHLFDLNREPFCEYSNWDIPFDKIWRNLDD